MICSHVQIPKRFLLDAYQFGIPTFFYCWLRVHNKLVFYLEYLVFVRQRFISYDLESFCQKKTDDRNLKNYFITTDFFLHYKKKQGNAFYFSLNKVFFKYPDTFTGLIFLIFGYSLQHFPENDNLFLIYIDIQVIHNVLRSTASVIL